MVSSRKLGRYSLIEQLAVGGMAEIWLALLSSVGGFEKLVVIKKIREHLAKEPSFLRMFLNEARLAAQLDHPNIVQIYELIQSGDIYFIAMEYIFGRDLADISYKLQEKDIIIPIEYAAYIIMQVCQGLYYAHNKTDAMGNPLNIVHRDISPHNILISFSGNVKILDFGIAKAANQFEQTRHGVLKGKLSYMSPEQILGYKLDGRSDIFSLGTVFYELLTGFRLFTGDNDLAIMRAITTEEIVRPSYFNDKIPPDLEAIVLRMLAKEPEDRYPDAREVQQDLHLFLKRMKFSPSSMDLSEFLGQLFADEIAREEEHIRKKIAQLKEELSEDEELLSEADIVEDERSYTNLLTADPFWAETQLSAAPTFREEDSSGETGSESLDDARPVFIQGLSLPEPSNSGGNTSPENPENPLAEPSEPLYRPANSEGRGKGEETITDPGAQGDDPYHFFGERDLDYKEVRLFLDPDLYELIRKQAQAYQWSVEEWIYNLLFNTLGTIELAEEEESSEVDDSPHQTEENGDIAKKN